MLKQPAMRLLRRMRLLEMADHLRYARSKRDGRRSREAFLAEHPGAPLPPDDVAYDAYGSLDWRGYWSSGSEIAAYLATLIERHADKGRLLEWGCGPGRIVRHLPRLLGDAWELHGSDYNPKTVAWCAGHLPRIAFTHNDLAPPFVYPDGYFSCVYAISVFTHLSETLHRAWIEELRRVLRPGGLLICTLHGDATRDWLLPNERERYDAGRLVVRSGVREGTRTYLAYHPPAYVHRELLRSFGVAEHIQAAKAPFTRQDVWVCRRTP